jgi:hypothetical protein
MIFIWGPFLFLLLFRRALADGGARHIMVRRPPLHLIVSETRMRPEAWPDLPALQ